MKTLVRTVLLVFGLAARTALAQERDGDRDRGKTERESETVYRGEDGRDHERGRTGRAERRRDENVRRDGDRERRRAPGGVLGDIFGVRNADIPPGHYPPPGECRVWYPDRPAGHQPPPEPCDRIRGRGLNGAFILHGNEAYDAGYDYERSSRRGSIPEIIIDLLGSSRRNR